MRLSLSAALVLTLALQPASFAAAQAAPSAAAPAQTPSPIRCLVLSSLLAKQVKTDTAKEAAISMMFYYLGKTDGSEPGADLKAKLDAETHSQYPGDAMTSAVMCSQAMEARADALHAASQALKQERSAAK